MNNLEIEVYKRPNNTGFNYQNISVFDEVITLSIKWNYRDFSTFEMRVPLSDKNIKLFEVDTVLDLQGTFFFIDSVKMDKLEDGYITISGKSLLAKAMLRIVNGKYKTTDTPANIAFNLLKNNVIAPSNEKRRVKYLTLNKPSIKQKNISYQNSHGNVFEQVTKMLETYQFGLKETGHVIANDVIYNEIDLYKGQDLSDTIEFSQDFENLLSESFESSNYDERTTAFIYGEGEGNKRVNVSIGTELAGLERKEIYVDARDLQSEQDETDNNATSENTATTESKKKKLTDEEYKQLLLERGKSKLAERNKVFNITGEISLESNLFKFRRDYNIGDRVKIRSTKLGLSKTAELTGIEEVFEDNKHTLLPTFDNESPTILDYIKRSKNQ